MPPELSVMVMDRLPFGVSVNASVTELLAPVGSVRFAGAAMLAVLEMTVPAGKLVLSLAVMVNVTKPSVSKSAVVLMLPLPDAAATEEPELATAVQVTVVKSVEKVSAMLAPVTAKGPVLVAT